MALRGMAEPMIVSQRSPLPSRAPGGTAPGSLACGTERTDWPWRSGHEGSFDQPGRMRDLYEGLYGARPRPGVQLAGRALRGCLRLYQESGPCRLDPDPLPL